MADDHSAVTADGSHDLVVFIRVRRRAFAAKVRMARAGLTQRATHKLEQSNTEPRRATLRVIEEVRREQGIKFEDLAGGGLRASACSSLLDGLAALMSASPAPVRARRAIAPEAWPGFLLNLARHHPWPRCQRAPLAL
jgi:hypothetical protein